MAKLISVLRAAAYDYVDLELADFTEAQICWAMTTGLGPLLFRSLKSEPARPGSSFLQLLKGADLTARVLIAEHLESMTDILDGSKGRVQSLALLKGISVCDQYYPEAHLRSMGDIDILVEVCDVPQINSVLLGLGFFQPSPKDKEFYRTHHHDQPWFHPRKRLWVEVHSGLFSPHSRLGKCGTFSYDNIKRELKASSFYGRPVMRLSEEVQLVYTACHWAQQLSCYRGVFGLVDIIYLLRRTGQQLQWDKVLEWTQKSIACAHLYLLLSYLHFNGILDIDSMVLSELFKNQRSFTKLNLNCAHFLITRCLIEGKVPKGRVGVRNLDILWKTLLLDQGSFHKLMLFSRNLLLPFRIRETVLP